MAVRRTSLTFGRHWRSRLAPRKLPFGFLTVYLTEPSPDGRFGLLPRRGGRAKPAAPYAACGALRDEKTWCSFRRNNCARPRHLLPWQICVWDNCHCRQTGTNTLYIERSARWSCHDRISTVLGPNKFTQRCFTRSTCT